MGVPADGGPVLRAGDEAVSKPLSYGKWDSEDDRVLRELKAPPELVHHHDSHSSRLPGTCRDCKREYVMDRATGYQRGCVCPGNVRPSE